MQDNSNDALKAKEKYQSAVESAYDYIERFDLLETITNVGNDEVFTPRKTVTMMLDSLPDEVWHNPNYKWLNPATKNGMFEREIAIRLNDGLKDIIPDEEKRKKHILQDMIYAFGQTKFTSNVARRTLYYCSEANRKCDGIVDPKDGHYVNGYSIGNGTWFTDSEGNIKTPVAEHWFDKKNVCRYCGIKKESNYNDPLQREHYAYEFIHYDRSGLIFKIRDTFFKGDSSMKFDIIIGNPPYQLSTNNEGIQAVPIYNKFVEKAIELKPKYLSMIIPSRWFTGGMGMTQFRENMLNDKHIMLLCDFAKSRDCFPTVDIAGGVCYFLWAKDYNGPCNVINQSVDKRLEKTRELNEYDVFIRNNIGVGIVDKVKAKIKDDLSSIVQPISPFALPTNTKGKAEPFNGSVKVFSSSDESYIARTDISKGQEYIDEYKVSIGQLNPDRGGVNNASDGKSNVTTKIKIYNPNEVFTATYLLLGSFKTKELAENYTSYIKTKFVRYLVLLTLSSMHITKDNFKFVPVVSFEKSWTDKELYEMFELNSEEIKNIESLVREMV